MISWRTVGGTSMFWTVKQLQQLLLWAVPLLDVTGESSAEWDRCLLCHTAGHCPAHQQLPLWALNGPNVFRCVPFSWKELLLLLFSQILWKTFNNEVSILPSSSILHSPASRRSKMLQDVLPLVPHCVVVISLWGMLFIIWIYSSQFRLLCAH